MYPCINFGVHQAKGSQDMEPSVYPYVQFDPWPLPNNIKIIRDHPFWKMYQGIQFDVHQVKGSLDIEWSVYSYVQFDPWPLT
jgi:hypothetical protein